MPSARWCATPSFPTWASLPPRAPALVIARQGDSIHPASVARRLAQVLPNAEAIVLDSEDDLFAAIPMLVERVSRFLEEAS